MQRKRPSPFPGMQRERMTVDDKRPPMEATPQPRDQRRKHWRRDDDTDPRIEAAQLPPGIEAISDVAEGQLQPATPQVAPGDEPYLTAQLLRQGLSPRLKWRPGESDQWAARHDVAVEPSCDSDTPRATRTLPATANPAWRSASAASRASPKRVCFAVATTMASRAVPASDMATGSLRGEGTDRTVKS